MGGCLAILCWAAFASVPPVATASAAGDGRQLLEQIRAERAKFQLILDEMNAMQEASASEQADLDDPGSTIRLYGFFETGLQRNWAKTNGFLNGVVQSPALTYILGDLYLYLDIVPAQGWRTLVEVRLTTSNGADQLSPAGFQILSTAQRRQNQPGLGFGSHQIASSLIIERAYVEHIFRDEFGVRLGLWLTPWGIWNVDHGSPALIPLIEPYIQMAQIYPTHQLGLAVFGARHLLPWRLTYHLGISNGRVTGPAVIPESTWVSFDVTDDKMISGRITLERQRPDLLRFGVSAYWGTSAQTSKQVQVSEPIVVRRDIPLELEEWGVGADFSYNGPRLRLRAEFTYTQYRFPRGRTRATFFPTRQMPDSAQYGGYALASFPFDALGLRIEPYAYFEAVWWPAAIAPRDAAVIPSLGLNLDPTPTIRLKTQYAWYRFFQVEDGSIRFSRNSEDDVHGLSFRAVVSF